MNPSPPDQHPSQGFSKEPRVHSSATFFLKIKWLQNSSPTQLKQAAVRPRSWKAPKATGWELSLRLGTQLSSTSDQNKLVQKKTTFFLTFNKILVKKKKQEKSWQLSIILHLTILRSKADERIPPARALRESNNYDWQCSYHSNIHCLHDELVNPAFLKSLLRFPSLTQLDFLRFTFTANQLEINICICTRGQHISSLHCQMIRRI